RAELDRWLRGEVKDKPKFLVDELQAYEKRLKDAKGKENLPLEGDRIVELIEPSPPAVVVTPAQTAERGKLASVAEVDEPATPPNGEPGEPRPTSP
ncbi:hypothetical protein FRC01_002943, partial [Tulasnella sp. 417]